MIVAAGLANSSAAVAYANGFECYLRRSDASAVPPPAPAGSNENNMTLHYEFDTRKWLARGPTLGIAYIMAPLGSIPSIRERGTQFALAWRWGGRAVQALLNKAPESAGLWPIHARVLDLYEKRWVVLDGNCIRQTLYY